MTAYADYLRMSLVSGNEDRPPPRGFLRHDAVDFGDKGAGGVAYPYAVLLQLAVNAAGNAMGTDHQRRAVRRFGRR